MRGRWAAGLVSLVAAVVIVSVPTAAAGVRLAPLASCHRAHTCPAADHQYVWNGLVCATGGAAVRGVDTKPVVKFGQRYLCHSTRAYPWHTRIVATTFWVGETFSANLADGSQACSTYDSQWAYHWSGIDTGTLPRDAAGCGGAIIGGCDGVAGPNHSCSTEPRVVANGFFPSTVTPQENPFYVDVPFDDVNDRTGFAQRCKVIPWASAPGFAGHCADPNFSYMKNRWVRIVGPNGRTCYGQVEDAGPSHGSLYHDAAYVFGSANAQPVQGQFNNAGMDVSPALNGCLGFAELDGDGDRVSWQFVDGATVPPGPWRRVVTTRPLFNH